MKTIEEFRKELKPFLEMIKCAKSEQNKEFLNNVEDFKKLLILKRIVGIDEQPLLLDKFVDEILEEN